MAHLFLHEDKHDLNYSEFATCTAGQLYANLYSRYLFNLPGGLHGVNSPVKEFEEGIGSVILSMQYFWVLYVAFNPRTEKHSLWVNFERELGIEKKKALNWPSKSLSALGCLPTPSPVSSPVQELEHVQAAAQEHGGVRQDGERVLGGRVGAQGALRGHGRVVHDGREQEE